MLLLWALFGLNMVSLKEETLVKQNRWEIMKGQTWNRIVKKEYSFDRSTFLSKRDAAVLGWGFINGTETMLQQSERNNRI